MQQREFDLMATDREHISTYHWSIGGSPRAVIVLSHGMGEHAMRYPVALKALIESGLDVYALDHRGHGAAALAAHQFGNFGPGGFAALVSDLVTLTGVAQKRSPGAPLILLGHSMGSMAAQLFAVQHSDLIDGLALSGTGAVDQIAVAARNPDVFGALNASFEPARTPFDWLSRSQQEVDTYIADPLCGFALTVESFGSMLSFGAMLADPRQLAQIRKTLPLYVFSGAHDPLNRDLHALQPVIDRYRGAGLDVAADIYPQARHEILNEINRAEVVGVLLNWIHEVVVPRAKRSTPA